MMWTGVGNRTFHNLKYYNQPNPPPQFDSLYTAAGFLDKNGSRDLVVPTGTETQVWLNSTSTAADPCAYPTSGGIHVARLQRRYPVERFTSWRVRVPTLSRWLGWSLDHGQKKFQGTSLTV